MSVDSFKQVFFNDGEGITFGDLNDVQRYLESKIWDQILHNQIGQLSLTGKDPEFSGFDGADHRSSFAFCLNPGSAYLRAGSANNKIGIAPGTLLQKIANITGNDSTILAYTFAGTEEWTLANGDATNPRVDLLQMQLAYANGDPQSRDFEDATTRIVTTSSLNKKRQVTCTLTTKAGTPAVSPVTPEPDAGCVPVGSVMVGNGWTVANAPKYGVPLGTTNTATVMDQRMPINVKAYRVDPTQMKTVTAWALNANKDTVTSSNATNELYALYGGPLGRIVGIGMGGSLSSFSSPTLQLGYVPGAAVTGASFQRMANFFISSAVQFSLAPFYTLDASPNCSLGPVIQASVTNKIGVPIWSNGYTCPYPYKQLEGNAAIDTVAGVKIASGATSTILNSIYFYVAEGC